MGQGEGLQPPGGFREASGGCRALESSGGNRAWERVGRRAPTRARAAWGDGNWWEQRAEMGQEMKAEN